MTDTLKEVAGYSFAPSLTGKRRGGALEKEISIATLNDLICH
jgi:hypothetical protein